MGLLVGLDHSYDVIYKQYFTKRNNFTDLFVELKTCTCQLAYTIRTILQIQYFTKHNNFTDLRNNGFVQPESCIPQQHFTEEFGEQINWKQKD